MRNPHLRRGLVQLLLGVLTIAAGAGVLWLLLGPITIWATPVSGLDGKDLADVRNATRQTLLAAVGGLVVLAGLGFTARTYYLTRRGQITDRYTKAVAQLASKRITERFGGIYALEHLMLESERDYGTVVEVLSAFVREHRAPDGEPPEAEPPFTLAHLREQYASDLAVTPSADVEAAITVMGRRRRQRRSTTPGAKDYWVRGSAWFSPILDCSDLRGIDMIGLQLQRASLWSAHLQGAVLLWTQLQGANLCHAQLQHASLGSSNLEDAALDSARLDGAVLHETNLRNADLSRASLRAASLGGANVEGARFLDAQLHGANFMEDPAGNHLPAQGLSVSQLASAQIDENTRLPNGFREALDEYRRKHPLGETDRQND